MNTLRIVRSFHVSRSLKNVTLLNSSADFQRALKSEKPVFIDFFATWCGPCKMVAPYLETVSNQAKGVDFYKLDVDDPNVREVVTSLQITAMPTFIAFTEGKEFNRIVGADPRKIKSVIDDLN